MMTLKNGPSGGLEHLELFLKTILNSKTDLEFIELLTDDNTVCESETLNISQRLTIFYISISE